MLLEYNIGNELEPTVIIQHLYHSKKKFACYIYTDLPKVNLSLNVQFFFFFYTNSSSEFRP